MLLRYDGRLEILNTREWTRREQYMYTVYILDEKPTLLFFQTIIIFIIITYIM